MVMVDLYIQRKSATVRLLPRVEEAAEEEK